MSVTSVDKYRAGSCADLDAFPTPPSASPDPPADDGLDTTYRTEDSDHEMKKPPSKVRFKNEGDNSSGDADSESTHDDEELKGSARFKRVGQRLANAMTFKNAFRPKGGDGVISQSSEVREHIEKAKKSHGKIMADDFWVPYWEFVLLLFTLYFEIAVTVNDLYDNWTFATHGVLDIIGTVVFTADIFLRFNMVSTEGHHMESFRDIARHYLKTWLVVDIIAAFPFDLLLLATGGSYQHKILYHLRLFRIPRVVSYFKQVNPEAICARYIYIHYHLVPLVSMLFWTLFALHLFIVIRLALIGDRINEPHSFVVAAYYIMYTVTSVGYGDVPVVSAGEKIFSCFLFIFGTFANAAIIGKLSKVMQANDIKSEKKSRMMETLAVMEYFNIPAELQQEVLAFQNHILQHNVGSSYSQIIDGLPASMQRHIGLYVRIKFISAVQMFQSASAECRVALAEGLHNVVFAPGQDIIRVGDVGHEMFFLGHGYADVLAPDGSYITTLKKGGFFGEVALLVETPRTATIRALTYCDCFRLDRQDFRDILQAFPDFNEQIQQEISRRELHKTQQHQQQQQQQQHQQHQPQQQQQQHQQAAAALPIGTVEPFRRTSLASTILSKKASFREAMSSNRSSIISNCESIKSNPNNQDIQNAVLRTLQRMPRSERGRRRVDDSSNHPSEGASEDLGRKLGLDTTCVSRDVQVSLNEIRQLLHRMDSRITGIETADRLRAKERPVKEEEEETLDRRLSNSSLTKFKGAVTTVVASQRLCRPIPGILKKSGKRTPSPSFSTKDHGSG